MEKNSQKPIDDASFEKSSKSVYFLPAILILLFVTGSVEYSDPVQGTQKYILLLF